MNARQAFRVGDLAVQLGLHLRGDGSRHIDGIASLEAARIQDLSYLADSRHRRFLASTGAGAVILTAEDAEGYDGTVLLSENPRLAFARAALLISPPPAASPGIDPTARVHPTAQVAADAEIGPGVVVEAYATVESGAVIGAQSYLGAQVHIGAGTRLWPRVTVLERCRIGGNGVLHSGAVVGGDGFGYARDGARWVKIVQLGAVVIGNEVEIGVNTAVDRGALGDTVIEDGVKLDNLIQVAHNVRIGANTAIAGCVGIAGSTRIGQRCMIGGGAGIGGHLEIADDVTIMGKSSITHSIFEAGVYSSTMSAQIASEWRRNAVRFRHLDEMARRLKKIEDQVRRWLSGDSLE